MKSCKVYFIGYGYKPYFIEGSDPDEMHRLMAQTLDKVWLKSKPFKIGLAPRKHRFGPAWPMIILRSPKGWTGTQRGRWKADRRFVALAPGSFLLIWASKPEHLEILRKMDESYRPEELFDKIGRLIWNWPNWRLRAPKDGGNPHANGGVLRKDLKMVDFRDYAVEVLKTRSKLNRRRLVYWTVSARCDEGNMHQFRVMGPDETASNRLGALFEAD